MTPLLLWLWSFSLQGSAKADGRLAVHIDDAKVMAASVRITGPFVATKDRQGKTDLVFDQLPAGDYDVEPVYDGGIPGARKSVHVESGKTAQLAIASEAVGAAQISAVEATCSAAVEFGVRRLAPMNAPMNAGRGGLTPGTIPGGPARSGGIVMSFNGMGVENVAVFARRLGSCFRLVGGLAAGSYQAFFNGESGLIAMKAFDVVEQQVAVADVTAPPAMLSGRVRYNGKPAQGYFLQLMSRGQPVGALTARLDADGRYRVSIPAVGDYSMSFRSPDDRMPMSLRKAVTVVEGDNTFDWDATGGTIVISVSNWDGKVPIQVTMQGASGMMMQTISPGDAYPVRIGGQPFGTYTVSGYSRDAGLVASAPLTLTLDESHLEASGELQFTKNPGTITLRDEAGAPVVGAMIRGTMTDTAAPASPGVYALASIPQLSPVVITAAGFTPACAISQLDGQTVTLTRGRTADVVFAVSATSASVSPPGAIVFAAGATTCDVTLSRFKYTKLATPAGEPQQFKFENFPSLPEFVWKLGTTTLTVTVPATGPIIIK